MTVANGGSLGLIEGVAAIGNDLTLQSGATLSVNLGGAPGEETTLTAEGAVTLGGATLTATIDHAPVVNQPYVIINKTSSGEVDGAFASGWVDVEYDGKTYSMAVNTQGGDGNDIELVYRAKGTVVSIR